MLNDDLKATSGGFHELNTILTTTQTKINRLKVIKLYKHVGVIFLGVRRQNEALLIISLWTSVRIYLNTKLILIQIQKHIFNHRIYS